jgi:hypothetical protein
MEKALSTLEVSQRLVELALAENTGTDQNTFNGVVSYVTRGHLANGRYASTRVSRDGQMLHVGLNVPGAGGMGVHFSLFADEATDERIERYLDHYLGLHEMAAEAFAAEQKVEASL